MDLCEYTHGKSYEYWTYMSQVIYSWRSLKIEVLVLTRFWLVDHQVLVSTYGNEFSMNPSIDFQYQKTCGSNFKLVVDPLTNSPTSFRRNCASSSVFSFNSALISTCRCDVNIFTNNIFADPSFMWSWS